jgi:DNA-binding CsgD family transcriptional regulator
MPEAEVKAFGLTPRQQEIMRRVAFGLTDREIGTALGISEQGVKNHLTQVYIRLKARNRAHAVFIMFCPSGSASATVSAELKKTQEIPVSGLLTLREAATFLHAHENSVRKWSDVGLLRPYRLGPRGDRRFRVNDLRQFLRHSSIQPK